MILLEMTYIIVRMLMIILFLLNRCFIILKCSILIRTNIVRRFIGFIFYTNILKILITILAFIYDLIINSTVVRILSLISKILKITFLIIFRIFQMISFLNKFIFFILK